MAMLKDRDYTELAQMLAVEDQLAFLRGIPTEVLMTELTRRVTKQEKLIETMEQEIQKAKRNP